MIAAKCAAALVVTLSACSFGMVQTEARAEAGTVQEVAPGWFSDPQHRLPDDREEQALVQTPDADADAQGGGDPSGTLNPRDDAAAGTSGLKPSEETGHGQQAQQQKQASEHGQTAAARPAPAPHSDEAQATLSDPVTSDVLEATASATEVAPGGTVSVAGRAMKNDAPANEVWVEFGYSEHDLDGQETASGSGAPVDEAGQPVPVGKWSPGRDPEVILAQEKLAPDSAGAFEAVIQVPNDVRPGKYLVRVYAFADEAPGEPVTGGPYASQLIAVIVQSEPPSTVVTTTVETGDGAHLLAATGGAGAEFLIPAALLAGAGGVLLMRRRLQQRSGSGQ